MKTQTDVSVIEIETKYGKMFCCAYYILGELNIKLVEHPKQALLYSNKELKRVLYDVEKYVRMRPSSASLSIRKIEIKEKKLFKLPI